jgi:hypothetical protein
MDVTPHVVSQVAPEAIERIRRRRAELRNAEDHLWWAKVSHATAELAARFHEHVDDTEREGGLYEEIAAAAPRLSAHLDRLRREHEVIAQAIRILRDGAAPVDPVQVTARREQILEVLSLLARHRFNGSDLLYEAYQVDIGAAD